METITELQWTRTTPTEIGWYVVWTPGDSYRDIVEIVYDLDKLCMLTQYGEWLQNLEDCKGSDDVWYGPIPQIFEGDSSEIQ